MMPSAPTNICTRWGWHFPNTTLSNGIKCTALFLIAIYIWFLPIGNTIAVRHLAFFSLILLTAWTAWHHQLKLRLPLSVVWLAYAAIALLSLTYAIDIAYSLKEIKQEIGYSILTLLIATTWVTNIGSFHHLMRILISGMTLMVGYAAYNALIVTPFWLLAVPEIRSLNNGMGTFSTYLITTIPFLVAFIWLIPRYKLAKRITLISLLICSIIALYLTANRMGFIALGIEVLFAAGILYFTSTWKINTRAVLIGIIVVTIVAGSLASLVKQRPAQNDPRMHIWQVATSNIKAHPMTGGGFGIEAYKLLNPEIVKAHTSLWHAHNMILNKGVQMGIPGMALFLLLFGVTLRSIWPTKKIFLKSKSVWVYSVAGSSMIIGMFVKNMTDDFFTNDPALLFWLLIGALIGAIRHENQHTTLNMPPDLQKLP